MSKKTLLIATIGIALLAQAIALRPAGAQESTREAEALFVAQKAFDDGFYDVALTLLERFQKSFPLSDKFADADLLIGQCYFHQSKFLEALKKFESLLEQPQARAVRDATIYWIAEVHFRGNNFQRAAVYYKRIIDEFPNSAYAVSAHYSYGWCLFQQQQYKEALEYFLIIERKYASSAQVQEAAFKIIECLYNLRDYTALKERLTGYVKVYAKDQTKSAYLYFYLAEADYYLGNFSDAIASYTRVLAGTQDSKLIALTKLGIGWCQLKLKNYPQAYGTFAEVNAGALEKRSVDVLLLGKAIYYAQTEQYDQARLNYDELIRATFDPLVLIQAYLGKAEAQYNLAQYPLAIDTYRQAAQRIGAEELPQEMADKLHYGLAWAYLKEGQFKEAIAEFQKIVSQTQDRIFKVSALCQIGDAYQDSGDLQRALETYDGILKDYPDNFYSDYVQYQLGLTLLKLSNYDAAIGALTAFGANHPGSKLIDDVSYALGLAYFQKQDYAASRQIFQRFQKDHRDSSFAAQALYLLGTSQYNLGDYNQAIETFKDVVRTYSNDAELIQKAEYEIADCYYQMGNEKEAMARFTALRSKYPDSSLSDEIMWWLGEYYYRKNDLTLALRYFSSLIKDFPNSALIPEAYYALGSIYAEGSKFGDAVENFERVIELSKSDLGAQAAIAIADIYVKQRKFDAALSTYETKLKEFPNLAHLIYPKIADTFYALGKYKEALDFYQRSLDLVPLKETPYLDFKIAEIQQAQGNSSAAIESYLKVTYLYSEDRDLGVKAFLRVAKIYEDQDKLPEAKAMYAKIAAMNVPEAKFARERIEAIESTP